MKGGDAHEFMLNALEDAYREMRVKVARQVPSCSGRRTGYVDLVAYVEPRPLAIEVEMSSRRIEDDLQKAEELGARLVVVVSNRRVANSVRRRLRQLQPRKTKDVCVLTLGQALQRVRNCLLLSRVSMVDQKTNTARKKQ